MITATDVGAASAISCGQTKEVIEHRDQGATRGQQQPSSLRSQLPLSLATPGARKKTSASPMREKEQEAVELKKQKTE